MPMATDCVTSVPAEAVTAASHSQACTPAIPAAAEDVKVHTPSAMQLQEPAKTEETAGESYTDQDCKKRKQVCTDDEERKARRRASNRNSAKRMRQQRSQVLTSLQHEVVQLRHMCQMLAAENDRCAQDCAEIENQNQEIRSEIGHLETMLSLSYDVPVSDVQAPTCQSPHTAAPATWPSGAPVARRLLAGSAAEHGPSGLHNTPIKITSDMTHPSTRPKTPLLQPLTHSTTVSPAHPRPSTWPSVGSIRTHPATRTSDYSTLPHRTSTMHPTMPLASSHCDFSTTSEEEAYSPACAFPNGNCFNTHSLKRPKLVASMPNPYTSAPMVLERQPPVQMPDGHNRSSDGYAPTATHPMGVVSNTFPRLTSRGGSSTGSDSYTASSYSSYTAMQGGSPGPVVSPMSKPFEARAPFTHTAGMQFRVTKPGDPTPRPPDTILSLRASHAGAGMPAKRPALSAAGPEPLLMGGESGISTSSALPSWQTGGCGPAAQDSGIENMLEQHAWYSRD